MTSAEDADHDQHSLSPITGAVEVPAVKVPGVLEYQAIMQIATMCETFDALPQKVRSYVLFQLLPGCELTTLQLLREEGIARIIRPDDLADLPEELGLQILKYLDSRSLCLAGLVNRRWYRLANTNDMWRDRFEKAGFKLGEVTRSGVTNPETIRYKEIYERHSLIRSNWMDANVRPHHISFRGHGVAAVTCLEFDRDRVISGSDDSTINIYETRTGRLTKTLFGHDGGVWALQHLDGVIVSGSADRTVRVWDIERTECTHVFHGHTSTVRCLQIIVPQLQPDGEYLPTQPIIVTGSRDTTLCVWFLPKKGSPNYLPTANASVDENPYFIRKLMGHSGSVRALSAGGNTLVSGSYDHTVRVWKISTGECRWNLQGH